MSEFPGNSQRARPPVRDEPPVAAQKTVKVERVIQGEVVRRKRPLGKRVRDMFVPEEGVSIREFVMADIIMPRLRDMFVDATIGSVERMVYGESYSPARRGTGRYGRPGGPTNYNAFSSQSVRPGHDPRQPQISQRARANHSFEEILIPSHQEAETVLLGMYDYLEQYNEVSVATLYELVGISSNFTDQNWGWTNLFGARPERVRGGRYVLSLPPPIQLER